MSLPGEIPRKLLEKSGVFVTLKTPANELRGCIGRPYPTEPLAEATINSAIEAATGDPRFNALSPKELEKILLEVSVLSPPEIIMVKDSREYPRMIQVGRDGLIVENGGRKGLLLPQVAVDYEMDEEEYLSQCCLKAGLSPDAWLLKETKIEKFQAAIGEEQSPMGEVTLRVEGGRQ